MRLTADLIVHARAGINPCDERELDLRGYKIPMIENLGVTQDQFDAMDLSDNEIKKVDNFPRYKRLSSILLCNNHVSRIAPDLGTQLPNLSCLILSNNKLTSLGELDGLRSCKKLTMLSLLHNEVVGKQFYRLYVINLVPSLKQLDFQKVTVKERDAAGRLARSQAGQTMMEDVAKEAAKSRTFTPGGAPEQKLTAEHRRIYAERIANAKTVEEVDMITKKLRAGIIPSVKAISGPADGNPVANGDVQAPPEATDEARAPSSSASESNKESTQSDLPSAAQADTSAMEVDGETAGQPAAVEESRSESETAMTDGLASRGAPTPSSSKPAGTPTASGVGSEPSTIAMDESEEEDRKEGAQGGDDASVVEEGHKNARAKEDEAFADKDGSGETDDTPQAGELPDTSRGSVDDQEDEEAQAEGAKEGNGIGEQGSADNDKPEISEADIKKLKVNELKAKLGELKLPINGLKADLQARLLHAMGY